MRALVTGCAGFIGSHLTEALLGAGDDAAAAIAGAPIRVFGGGGQTRDFTFVGDVVEATSLAASTPDVGGRTYNLGGGAQIGLNDAIGMIEEIAGKPLQVIRDERETGDVRDTGADTTRARTELGFEPSVDFREGLARQFAWVAADAAL